jgi:hypothetical protein
VELTQERNNNGETTEIDLKATIDGDRPFNDPTAFEKAIYADKCVPAAKGGKETLYTGKINGLKYNLKMYTGKTQTTAV